MSFTSDFSLNLIGDLAAPYALIIQSNRSIGNIIPNIVTKETHQDLLTITEHPVEVGATISDHAFNNPPTVEMRCGFSDSTAASEGYVQAIYQEFLALQFSKTPFSVSTGKRFYSNMLIAAIEVMTDETSEFALDIVVDLQNVIITDTTSSGSASQPSASSNPSNNSLPQQTAPTANVGPQTPLPDSSVGDFPTFSGTNFG